MIRDAWQRIQRLKEEVGTPGVRADRRSIVETYNEGEAWLRRVLDAAGVGSEDDIDELARIIDENGRATLHNLLTMPGWQLREAAIAAGIAKPTDRADVVERVMMLTLMHSAGFSNGLALGLTLRDE